jgi:predicted FMN-binding regulatory protein PaiB
MAPSMMDSSTKTAQKHPQAQRADTTRKMWNTGANSRITPSTERESKLARIIASKECITRVRGNRALSAGRPQTETTNTRVLLAAIISSKEKVYSN